MTTEQREALALIRSSLGRARVAQIILGLVFAGFAWLFTLAGETTLGGKILMVTMTAFFMLVAAVLFWVALFKVSPSRSPLVRALVERPDDVLRVYEQAVQVEVHGVEAPTVDTNVMVQLADGSTVGITVNKAVAPRLVEAIRLLAPRAAVGPA
jgi:hypothetical protein